MLNRQDKPIIIFNQSNIQKWQDELKIIPDQLRHQHNIIKEQKISFHSKKQRYDVLKIQIQPLEATKSLIQSSLSYLESQDFSDTVDHFFGGKKFSLGDTLNDMGRTRQIHKLRKQIVDIDKQLAAPQVEINQLISHMDSHEQKIQTAKEDLNRELARQIDLNKQCHDGDIFLKTLAQNPLALVKALDQRLINSLEDFEEECPAQQSMPLRQAILEIKRNKHIIVNDENLYDAHRIRLQFHALCGLLGVIYERLKNSQDVQEKIFAQTIFELIRETHVAIHGDLPDQLSISIVNTFYYQQSFQAIAPHELEKFESNEFKQACKDFRSDLLKINPANTDIKKLINNGFNLIADLKRQKIDAPTPDEFDSNLATTMIRHAHELLKPHDESLHRSCRRIANLDAKNQPSANKKTSGLLLIFLGSVIIVGSTLAAVASFGAASPLSAMGIMVGATLLAQSLSVTAGVVGVSMTLTGIGLFNGGTRKGASKDLTEMANARNRCPHFV